MPAKPRIKPAESEERNKENHALLCCSTPSHVARRVYIGVSNKIANSFVVEVVSHFLKNYDSISRPKVTLISGSHAKLAEQLHFREIDVLVSQLAVKNPELDNLEKVEVPVNLVCFRDKEFKLKIRTPDITGALKAIYKNSTPKWVVPSAGFKLRAEIDNFFEVNLLKGNIVFESDVVESLSRSVVDEVGITLLPLIYVPKELEQKTLISIGPKKGFWKHRVWIACHNKRIDDSLVKSLAKSFKEVCNPLISR